jgi:Ser/Thr protein kinase RdoA (MazF antagonist)
VPTSDAPYAGLSPDVILDAVAAAGFEPDGRMLALGSYENRVFQVGIEEATPLVAKFYRPARWSNAAIAEEHAFAHELVAAELPVVAPMRIDGRSLLEHAGFRYSLYPRQGGRSPELESRENLEWMGRLLARMHAVGSRGAFAERGRIDLESFVRMPARAVLASDLLPATLQRRYRESTGILADRLEARLEAIAISATCSGPMPARISSISTMHAWDRPCRTCGCSRPRPTRSRSCSKAMPNSAISTSPKWP